MTQKKTTTSFIEEAKKLHGDKYDYSKSKYTGARDKIEIICPEHGSFHQLATNHLRPCGCPACAGDSIRKGRGFDKNTFDTERANLKHGSKYNYSKVKFSGTKSKVEIVCPEHGSFLQTPDHHYQGSGCPVCGKLKADMARNKSTEDFIAKAKLCHGDKYDYSKANYSKIYEKVEIICPDHGSFWQTPANHAFGKGCPQCATSYGPSKAELEVFEFVKTMRPDAEQSVIGLLDGRQEIDILIPSLKIAIEFNGLIWHSEKVGKDRNYHQRKTDAAREAGYRMIHIWADEWEDKRQWCEAFLRRVCGAKTRKVFARKCEIKKLTTDDVKDFLDINHLQGFRGGEHLGVFHQKELVAVATWAVNSTGENELIRWCVKLDVSLVGGFSKVMKLLPKNIVSFCDTAKHDGKGYIAAGWKLLSETAPMYYYTDGKRRYARQRFQKQKLVAKGGIGGTEKEMAASLGFYQIGGLRQMKFVK